MSESESLELGSLAHILGGTILKRPYVGRRLLGSEVSEMVVLNTVNPILRELKAHSKV
jgi:hypothetical protein